MAYKEYHRYIGKIDRPDAALCTNILEVKLRKEAAAAWQANSDGIAPDVFADDVPNPDHKAQFKSLRCKDHQSRNSLFLF